MSKHEYLTSPVASEKMPAGVPYILFNEMAERFAFYGMTAILVFYMTHHLYARDGTLAPMGDKQATYWFHFFKAAVYFLPILGALISDIWLGKFKTVLLFSVVYCIGFFALTGDDTRLGLGVGLVLIAVGSGIIKPCVSANVGDQFGKANQHLLSSIYGWFYFAINLGAGISMWFCPELRAKYGPQVAFGVPAFFMVLATAAYWMGRRKFVHVPPAGWGFVKETLSGEGLRVLGRLSIIYLFVAMFWALFDQSQSAWVLQAEHMDLEVWGYTLKPEQPQAFNPWLVMIMIPLFTYVMYPAIDKVFRLTALRKISIGLFVAALSFLVSGWIETRIQAGATPHIGWQFVAYVVLTAAEIMVSITVLEYSYTQAPKRMKSFIQSLCLVSIAVGNSFTAVVNWFIENEDGSSKLEGASYYWFFVAAMAVTAVLFIFVAGRYREKTYIQDESEVG
ncbi:MAG: POT family MFS transporter [Planctomycetota bacterium]|jgi:POT family proton-dependent oligopeptide transporter